MILDRRTANPIARLRPIPHTDRFGAPPLRREQRVDESIPDNRDGDYDIDAQQDQHGQDPPAQFAARERALSRLRADLVQAR